MMKNDRHGSMPSRPVPRGTIWAPVLGIATQPLPGSTPTNRVSNLPKNPQPFVTQGTVSGSTAIPPHFPSSAGRVLPSASGPNSDRPAQGNALLPAPWQGQRGISVILSSLPLDITTKDIWRSFKAYHLTVIELYENRQGVKSGRARLVIEPPPKHHPWPRGRCTIIRENSNNLEVRIAVQSELPSGQTFLSPLNNRIPIKSSIKLTCLRFGNLTKDSTMMEMRNIKPDPHLDELQLMFDFTKRLAHITFSIRIGEKIHTQEQTASVASYKVSVKFGSMKKLRRVISQAGDCGILLPMALPPRLSKLMASIEESHSPDKLLWIEADTWCRQTSLMSDPTEMRDQPTRLNTDQFIDIGRWMTYYMEIDPQYQLQWGQIEKYLMDFNIHPKPLAEFSLVPQGATTYWSMVGDVAENHSSSEAMALLFRTSSVSLSFDVRYQMEVCLSKGLLNDHSISQEFLTKLATFTNDRARILLEGIVAADKPIYDPMTAFENTRVLHYYSFAKVPSYCTLMRRAIVTPTTIYFSTPTVEVSNRVMRKYSDLADHFMRVQFTDELSDGRIYAGADSRNADEILLRVYRTLKNGIVVGGRHYSFLAFGNSQIRECGAYFFSNTSHVTCDNIRKWMGNFENIHCVAKYAARMGQCFSTTKQIPGYSIPSIIKIPDIERNGYCYTDGVGKISDIIANVIANDFILDNPPSVFQFRMGGCKGVLAVWPDVKHNEVHIRQSQAKFNAIHNSIEIVRWSSYSVATLNRQTITVLSSLGVHDSVFISMLEEQLANYDKAMENKMEAMDLLSRYIDQNETTIQIANMIVNGFMDAHEPFVWTLLKLWKAWSVKGLKEKARIVVEKSAFVLGCVDETGILRGYTHAMEKATNFEIYLLPQIFLQIPDPKDRRKYIVITGVCLVGRNPSLHPGDLRVVEAVDVPELRHIKNAVVFSQNGDRDVPSMCSGGDLDGDDFFVFWDQNLIPPQWNYPPMNYTAPQPEILDRDVDISDIIRFFVLYMKNDSLPHIAHAHLAQADRLEGIQGGDESHAKHPKCLFIIFESPIYNMKLTSITGLELAALHSKAVDYVKSGVPAEMPKRLLPTFWPHFMEKRKKSYRSEQALGKLYDRIQMIEFEPAYEMPFDKRVLEKFKLDKDILRKARQIKSRYDTAMRQLMGQNEINTEFEAWSAFVLTRPLVGNDYKRQEDIGREAQALKARFVDLCFETGGIKHDHRSAERLDPFVAAMYQVTNEEVQIARHESKVAQIGKDGTPYARNLTPASMPLISFPWLFPREMGRIVSGRVIQFTFGDYNLPSAQVEPPTQPTRDIPLGADELDDMEYAHTSDGQVMHRGEVLNLFDHMDEDEYLPVPSVEAETPRLDEVLGKVESSDSVKDTAQGSRGDLLKTTVISPSAAQSLSKEGSMIDERMSKAARKENLDTKTNRLSTVSGPSSVTEKQPLHPRPSNQVAKEDSPAQISSSPGPPFKSKDQALGATPGNLSDHVPGAPMTPTGGIKEIEEIEEDEGLIEDELDLEASGETALERAIKMFAS